jgi:hypothetical protein
VSKDRIIITRHMLARQMPASIAGSPIRPAIAVFIQTFTYASMLVHTEGVANLKNSFSKVAELAGREFGSNI